MAILDKAELLKTLRTVANFDANASPFVAVQLSGSSPALYRSSSNGFVQSSHFGLGELTYVSLAHLRDCLQILKDDQIELGRDPNGVLRLRSTDHVYESELRIHTVRPEQAGLKHHEVGEVTLTLDPTHFTGFDARPFTCAAQPTLIQGSIMLPTTAGIVIWNGPDELRPITLQPRESALRLLHSSATKIALTDKGYWGVETRGLVSFLSGHQSGRQLYDSYRLPTTELGVLPAPRLLVALSAAASVAGESGRIDVCPTQGIITRDQLGNPAKFAIGSHQVWNKFAITGKTARTIVEAFTQTREDDAALALLASSHPTMRLTRGRWEVNFRTF